MKQNVKKKVVGKKVSKLKQIPHRHGVKKESFDYRKLMVPGIIALVLCILVSIVHIPSVTANAELFDDEQYLTENQLVKNPSFESAMTFLTEVLNPSTVNGYYQPLAMISLMVDYAMGGNDNNRAVFHRTSLLLHLFNTIFVMAILYLLFGNPYVAGLVALVFGTHPMTVETVAWVGERKTTLAAFYALLSIICYILYLKFEKKKFYILCVVMYLFALMSKPTSTMLPIAFLLMDFWPFKRVDFKNAISILIEKIPMFVLTLIFGIITFLSQKNTGSATVVGEVESPIAVLWRICHNIMFYPLKMLYPNNLSSHYPIPNPLSLSNPVIIESVIFTVILITTLIFSLKKTRIFFIGWSIFFVLVFPTIGVVGFTNAIASDKYAYLPVIGFLMPVAYFLNIAWHKTNKWIKSAPITIIACTAVIFIAEWYGTYSYAAYWENTEKVYRYMLNLAPEAPVVYCNLGVELHNKGRIDESIECFKKAIQYSPTLSTAYNDLGYNMEVKGQNDEAIQWYNKAITINPKYVNAYYNMGSLLLRMGRVDDSVDCFRKCILNNPNDVASYSKLGNALDHKGDMDGAMKYFKMAMEINPKFSEAYNNYANILNRKGNLSEAVQYYKKAIELKSDSFEVYANLGKTLNSMGSSDEALMYYQKAITLNPKNPNIYVDLGNALKSMGNIDSAMECYKSALYLNPKFPDVYISLATAYKEKGDNEQAVSWYEKGIETNPDSAPLYRNYVLFLLQQNRMADASKLLPKAIELNPNDKQLGELAKFIK